jgi:hypothetical protein
MAAQSVLAAASLAAQAHADLLLPFGQPRPLSLYLVTVAASGDRKTSSDNEALWPIRKDEKALKDRSESEYEVWSIAHASWTAERRKIEGDKKLNYETRKTELRNLGPEPPRPLHPFPTAADPTIEGLVKAWSSAQAALGIFTAEGGQFTNGHGMSQENRLRTAAACSELWDTQPIKRVRAADGVTILRGRRLAMHLMLQPDAAAAFLADRVLRDQGVLSRMLVAAPDSLAGMSFYRETLPDDDAAIRAYGARLLSLLEAPWPLAAGKSNELEPRTLPMSADVAAEWRAFHDHIESQCGRGQQLSGIQDFAAKAAEHAARIAGVLTIVEDRHAGEISPSAMEGALTLTDWYVAEAVRLHGAARTDPRLLRSQQLLAWMQSQGSEEIDFREVLRLGPGPVRTKAIADEALAILMDHGWVRQLSDRPRRFRVVAAEGG